MNKKRRLLCFLLVLICMKSLVVHADSGTLDIRVEGKGVRADVYQVGTMNEDGSVRFKENYGIVSRLSNAQEVKSIINKLDECVDMKADISKKSDNNGVIKISGLKEGVYYIRFSGGEYKREYVSALIEITEDYREIHPKYEEVNDSEQKEIIKTGDDNEGVYYFVLCITSCIVFGLARKSLKKNLGGSND